MHPLCCLWVPTDFRPYPIRKEYDVKLLAVFWLVIYGYYLSFVVTCMWRAFGSGIKEFIFWLRLILEIIRATVGFGNKRTRERGEKGRESFFLGLRLDTLGFIFVVFFILSEAFLSIFSIWLSWIDCNSFSVYFLPIARDAAYKFLTVWIILQLSGTWLS